MRSQWGKAVLALLLGIGLLGGTNESQVPGLYIPAEPGRGDEWLQWNEETRNLFVYAYSIGYLNGSDHACSDADRLCVSKKRIRVPQDTLIWQCRENERTYAKPLEFYAGKITQFYETYPEDKKIPARFLLRELSDKEARTLEELHQLAQSGALLHGL